MPISCSPSDLSADSACYRCIPQGATMWVKLYLLNQIAATGLTPEQLLEAAEDFAGIPEGMQKPVEAMLLCLINGGTLPALPPPTPCPEADCMNLEGAGDPV